MHKLRMDVGQPTVSACPLLWIRCGEIKRDQTENSCVLFVNVLLSPSLHMLMQLFSSISVNSGFQNIHLHVSHVGEYSATIHLDFRE